MAKGFITHHWASSALGSHDVARSECGLPVAMAYSVNGHGFDSDWARVDCDDCLAHKKEAPGDH